MILDNLSRAFKTQNWLAACVEFVIVLAGVVAGFQISAWAEARAERERETLLLARLEADFTDIQTRIEGGLGQCAEGQQNAATLSALLADAPSQDRATLVNAVGRAITSPVPVARSATYVELLASGEMALIEDEDLRRALVRFDEEARLHELSYETLSTMTFQNSGILFETLSLASSPAGARLDADITARLEGADLASAAGMMVVIHQQNCRSFTRVQSQVQTVLAALSGAPTSP